jgi:hypothetical protein
MVKKEQLGNSENALIISFLGHFHATHWGKLNNYANLGLHNRGCSSMSSIGSLRRKLCMTTGSKRMWMFSTAVMLMLSVGSGFAMYQKKHPHMQAALQSLQTAKNQLQMAEADKGGHRNKAIAEIEDAISHVKAGINYENRHDNHAGKPSSHPGNPQH